MQECSSKCDSTKEDCEKKCENARYNCAKVFNDLSAVQLKKLYELKNKSAQNSGWFDYNNDGFETKTAWVNKEGSILIYKNKPVAEDNFNKFDTNNDGVIDTKDNTYSNLGFLDINGKKKTLKQENIVKIATNIKKAEENDEFANIKYAETAMYNKDGKEYGLEYYFYTFEEGNIREAKINIPKEIKKLPEIKSYGNVHSLHYAMTKDKTIKELVEQFIKEKNLHKQIVITDKILKKWTKNDKIKDEQKLHAAIVNSFASMAIENNQATFEDKMNVLQINPIESEDVYLKIQNYVYAELMRQSHLKSVIEQIQQKNGQIDLTNVVKDLSEKIKQNSKIKKYIVYTTTRVIKGLLLDTNSNFLNPKDEECFYLKFTKKDRKLKWMIDTIAKIPYKDVKFYFNSGTFYDDAFWGGNIEKTIATDPENNPETILIRFHALDGDDVMYGYKKYSSHFYACEGNDIIDGGDGDDIVLAGNEGNDIIFGNGGDDAIFGGDGDDIIFGGDGNDTIYSDRISMEYLDIPFSGKDIIVGGKGNDRIISDLGDDTFIFRLGDGQDVIEEIEGHDTIYFGKGIKPSSLLFKKEKNDLVIYIKNTKDSITIRNWFSGEGDNMIEEIEFANGKKISTDKITIQ